MILLSVFHVFYLSFTPQYLERELRMEGLPFPYSFEVCEISWKSTQSLGFTVRGIGGFLVTVQYMYFWWCGGLIFRSLQCNEFQVFVNTCVKGYSVIGTYYQGLYNFYIHLIDERFFENNKYSIMSIPNHTLQLFSR